MFVCVCPLGTYVCSFNGTEDLTSIDNNTALHVYVYDQVHLITREDFDFQQFVQVNSRIFGVEKKTPFLWLSAVCQGWKNIKKESFWC